MIRRIVLATSFIKSKSTVSNFGLVMLMVIYTSSCKVRLASNENTGLYIHSIDSMKLSVNLLNISHTTIKSRKYPEAGFERDFSTIYFEIFHVDSGSMLMSDLHVYYDKPSPKMIKIKPNRFYPVEIYLSTFYPNMADGQYEVRAFYQFSDSNRIRSNLLRINLSGQVIE